MPREEGHRKFVGSGQTRNVVLPDGRSFTVLEFRLFKDDIKLLSAMVEASEYDNVRITIAKRKHVSEKGQTHYGTVYVKPSDLNKTAHDGPPPQNAHNKKKANGYQKQTDEDEAEDDIPF